MSNATPYVYGAANPMARHPTESLDYAEAIDQIRATTKELVLRYESMIGKARPELIEACVALVERAARVIDERKKV